ncbi:uncharacterized protein RSE6_09997 [Rhynchosporium secalis]|uniref:Aminoglycoside phosphotransferase domain-containing protein n=1 Tax=Rhynchosporium secalis TaxID=38038 RepID=A0A1E1MJE4_RHYSE|nr:uncharacterized protein RSE6_09997 [Rhynchosporium secalis]
MKTTEERERNKYGWLLAYEKPLNACKNWSYMYEKKKQRTFTDTQMKSYSLDTSEIHPAKLHSEVDPRLNPCSREPSRTVPNDSSKFNFNVRTTPVGQAIIQHLSADKNNEAWEITQKRLRRRDTCELAASLVRPKFGAKATYKPPLIIGGYNILYKVQVKGRASDIYVRLPCPDWVQFPIEKTLQEGTTARYVEQQTQIPVPKVFYYSEESDLGPFMILQHMENSGLMADRIKQPYPDPDVTSILDPDISESVLSNFYEKVAQCLLQISRLLFDRIGSLSEDDSHTFSVTGRPLSKNMNDMLQLANIPRYVLPLENKTFETTDK